MKHPWELGNKVYILSPGMKLESGVVVTSGVRKRELRDSVYRNRKYYVLNIKTESGIYAVQVEEHYILCETIRYKGIVFSTELKAILGCFDEIVNEYLQEKTSIKFAFVESIIKGEN